MSLCSSFVRGATAVVVALVVLGSTSGAGAAGTTSTKKWASGVCGAVQAWLDDVDSTVQGLKGAASLDDAVAQAKTGVQSADDALARSLDDLGRPQSSDGKKVQRSIKKLADDLDAVGASIQETLAAPPSTAVEIAATFADVGGELGKAQKALQIAATGLKGLDPGGDLAKAFKTSASCKKLKRSL